VTTETLLEAKSSLPFAPTDITDTVGIRAFVRRATERLYPSSDAGTDERAFVAGQVLGLLARLARHAEWVENNRSVEVNKLTAKVARLEQRLEEEESVPRHRADLVSVGDPLPETEKPGRGRAHVVLSMEVDVARALTALFGQPMLVRFEPNKGAR
jgi:hypothetical protein